MSPDGKFLWASGVDACSRPEVYDLAQLACPPPDEDEKPQGRGFFNIVDTSTNSVVHAIGFRATEIGSNVALSGTVPTLLPVKEQNQIRPANGVLLALYQNAQLRPTPESVIASLRRLFPARADGWTKRWDELATRLQTIIDAPTPAFDKARETLACPSQPRERRLIDTSARHLDTGNVLERNEGDIRHTGKPTLLRDPSIARVGASPEEPTRRTAGRPGPRDVLGSSLGDIGPLPRPQARSLSVSAGVGQGFGVGPLPRRLLEVTRLTPCSRVRSAA